MTTARRVAGALLALALLGATAACALVSRPDATGWDREAERALTDLRSEVATARLALETAAEQRAWPSYVVVLLADAEEAAGTAEEDLSALQVPPAREDAALEVEELMAEAVAAVQDARALAVAGRYDDPPLLEDLDALATRLATAAAAASARGAGG